MTAKLYSMTEAAHKTGVPRSALMNAVLKGALHPHTFQKGTGFKTMNYFLDEDLQKFKRQYFADHVQAPTDITTLKVEADKTPAKPEIRVRKRIELLEQLRELRKLRGVEADLEEILCKGEQDYGIPPQERTRRGGEKSQASSGVI